MKLDLAKIIGVDKPWCTVYYQAGAGFCHVAAAVLAETSVATTLSCTFGGGPGPCVSRYLLQGCGPHAFTAVALALCKHMFSPVGVPRLCIMYIIYGHQSIVQLYISIGFSVMYFVWSTFVQLMTPQ